MKFQELKQKSKDELKKNLTESREKIRQLRFDLSAGKVKNVRQVRKTKKLVARILTLLKEKKYDPVIQLGSDSPRTRKMNLNL